MSKMTVDEVSAIASLRYKGYAVVVMSPRELGNASADHVEDMMVEHAQDIITINQ